MDVRGPSQRYVVGQAGYQETDGGLIPVDWRYTGLTELARLESGHTPSRRSPSYWKGDIPWVSLHDTESLDDNEIFQTAQTISAEGLKNSSARLLPKGTVVFSRTATVGKSTVMGREMATSQDFANYICGPDVHNRFLVYLFRHMAPEWKKLMAGSIHNTVYMPAFRSLRVVLPPRSEQQAIAEALSDADALIECLSVLLAKKRQIKQGAMQELLTGKKRLPGFGEEWSEKSLGDLFQFSGGLSASRDQLSTRGHLYLHYGDIHTSAKSFIDVEGEGSSIPRLDVPFVKIQPAALLADGDVVFVDASEDDDGVSRHVVVVNPEGVPFIAGLHTIVAKQKREELNSAYLRYCFQTRAVKEQFKFYAVGTKVSGISKRNIAKIVLHIPPRDEQSVIAEMLVSIDQDIAALEVKQSKVRQLKQAMMQALLTGRIRLMQPASNVIPLPVKPPSTNTPPPQSAHNWQINEAVVIGMLAQRFGTEKFPLPRKRRVKLMYLLHRHAEGRAEGYLKKAAGPYDPNTKYKGPEAIALKNGYVRAVHNGTYEGFVAGDKSDQAQRYFEQWYGMEALDWLERFHYRKTDDLELLATVDMTMVDVAAAGQSVDVASVKRVIAAHPEWVPKLSRALFSDDHIASAIAECATLFPA